MSDTPRLRKELARLTQTGILADVRDDLFARLAWLLLAAALGAGTAAVIVAGVAQADSSNHARRPPFAPAIAGYHPKLTIRENLDTATTDIGYSQRRSDDAPAEIDLAVPVGFTFAAMQSPGTQTGTVDGHVVVGSLGGVTAPVSGKVVVGDPTSEELRAEAARCIGGIHPDEKIWVLTFAGTSLQIPAIVPPAVAGEGGAIWICLPRPSQDNFQIHSSI